ncbi:MAG TPA: LLM class flavin-dependent oxidoreductase, partial [Thermoleophilaceae bacterium]|nr:LLM class flavin-dependent oxidoreductase [Thermoleophilaceae bacterium]
SRMRSTIVAVRALLEGGRLPLDREGVRALRLGAPPERPVPILLAALAQSSVRLAGELADHWLPFLWARSRIQAGRALLAEGEARTEPPAETGVTGRRSWRRTRQAFDLPWPYPTQGRTLALGDAVPARGRYPEGGDHGRGRGRGGRWGR